MRRLPISFKKRSARVLIVFGVCLAALPAARPTAQTSATVPDETAALVLPVRRPADAPPTGPPDFPSTVKRVTPLTITAVIRRASGGSEPRTLTQTISRTADRIHVARSDKREWLFEQNPVDPRRVSGLLVDHAARTVVAYEESDLRLGLGIRGWADVLCLGFDPGILKRLRSTGRTREIGGIEFSHYSGALPADPHEEAWWSEALGFASHFVIRDETAATTFSVERITDDVDRTMLEPPSARFPSYRLIDLAAWLERR